VPPSPKGITTVFAGSSANTVIEKQSAKIAQSTQMIPLFIISSSVTIWKIHRFSWKSAVSPRKIHNLENAPFSGKSVVSPWKIHNLENTPFFREICRFSTENPQLGKYTVFPENHRFSMENPQAGKYTVFREIIVSPWKIHNPENPPYFPEIFPASISENVFVTQSALR
jgi:hypothetical protein